MLLSEVAKLSATERFLYWIQERNRIHYRRLAGRPKPWTDDEVLQNYFFTNPYREHDKTTIWFKQNVRDPLQSDPMVVFATIAFRWFNYIPTGKVLLDQGLLTSWNLGKAKDVLRGLDRVFTGAFNISNSGSTKPKIDRVCDDYIQPVWDALPLLLAEANIWKTMQHAHRDLKEYPGLGGSGFMAYEIVCDLRYTDILKDALDKTTWSNPGPGAKRGINRILGRALNASVPDYQLRSRELLELVQTSLPKLPTFEMREIEHALCELDKYERARLGDGHMKRKYDGTGERE